MVQKAWPLGRLTDAEVAQAIVYWLCGRTQKEIGGYFRGHTSGTPVCSAIWAFCRQNLAPDEWQEYGWSGNANRKRLTEVALGHWCREQPVRPRLRLPVRCV